MNIIKKRAIIFDCDGVMFDSRKANISYYNFLLEHFNLPPMSKDKIEYIHMNTADDSVNHIFEGTPHLEEAVEFKKTVDYSPFLKDMIIEPGLKDLLRELKPDFGLAVATNRSNTIGRVIEINGLKEYFDIVISSLDVTKPKPDPESLIKILHFFNMESYQALYVGDSHIDYLTAIAAGVSLVAYKNPDLDAKFHVNSMAELSDLLKSIH